MNTTATVSALMLDTFNQILTDRMYEDADNYIRECLLDSVSPVVRIDYHNGIVLCINRDDYGHNAICKATHDYGGEASVYIDGKDIFAWD